MNSQSDNLAVTWKALTYFNFYRFLIALLFVSLVWIGQLPEPLGLLDPLRTTSAPAANKSLISSLTAAA